MKRNQIYSFVVPDSRQIQFNAERFVPGHYRINNYRRSETLSSNKDGSSLSYDYFSVGERKIGRHQQGELNIVLDSIVWPDRSIVVNIDGQERCEPCRLGYWPTTNRIACYKLKETSMEWNYSLHKL